MKSPPPEVLERMQEMIRAHEAQENVRRQQQGFGNPVISTMFHGYRFVAVGATFYWGKDWLVFPDFLLYFLKRTFGFEWGTCEKAKGQHPVFRWLQRSRHYSDSLSATGKLKIGPIIGFFACWLHLAYALYLIQHNDHLPRRLLKRLRERPSFMPAYFEAIVGAALAVAGFELSCAELKASSVPTPEFRAKSKTSGITYEVEAKRKERWKAPTDDPTSPEFELELERYVRDQIHGASKKKLNNPIYCFELSIPTLTTAATWRTIATKVDAVIRQAENTITVDGEPIVPAFVFISNHTFLVNEEIVDAPFFGFLATVRIDDFPLGHAMAIEAALEGYDKYRDIFWLADAWKVANTVPTTFDGSPPELLSQDGQPQKTIQVGDMLPMPNEAGIEVATRVEDIVSIDDKATVVVHDIAANKRWLAQFPLSEAEVAAAAHFTDAVFGKSGTRPPLRDTDPFDLYDFFLETYGKMTQEQADKLFAETPAFLRYRGLPLKEARVRIAREYTKLMWARHSQKEKEESPQAQSSDT